MKVRKNDFPVIIELKNSGEVKRMLSSLSIHIPDERWEKHFNDLLTSPDMILYNIDVVKKFRVELFNELNENLTV